MSLGNNFSVPLFQAHTIDVVSETIVTVKSSGLYLIQSDSQFPLFPSPNYS